MRYIALDLETRGLDARHNPLVPVWVVGLAEFNGEAYERKSFRWNEGAERVRSLLLDAETIFVCHNASFDIAVLRTRGLDIPSGRYVCSALAAYMLQPGTDISLATLAEANSTYKVDVRAALNSLGHTFKSDEELFSYNFEEDEAAWEVLASYCEQDCEAALVVWNKVSKLLHRDEKLSRCYYELQLPYVECIIDMERTGMYIDQEALQKLKRNLQKRIAALENVLVKLVPYVPDNLKWRDGKYEPQTSSYTKGYYKNKLNIKKFYTDVDGRVLSSEPSVVYEHCDLVHFNPNSGRHLAWVLMGEGWMPQEFSRKTTEPVVDHDVLELLVDKHPLARVYTAYNTYAKLLGTFVEGIEKATDSKGFCHTSFNQTVTRTTRLSSSSPNLQNLPARTALGAKVRDCVVAPPGYTLIVADLDQIELRVLAYYLELCCGESRLADAARRKEDLHQTNANAWNVTRKVAKTGIFAVNYGAQAPRLAGQLHCSVEAAQATIDGINNGMPAIPRLKEKVWAGLSKRRKEVVLYDKDGNYRNDGIIYTLFGSRLHYHKYNHRWEGYRSKAQRQSFNALIQGSSSDINKELGLRTLPILRHYGGLLSFAVHDESGAYVPDEVADTVLTLLNQIYVCSDILRHSKNFVPVTGEWHSGRTWNEAKGK